MRGHALVMGCQTYGLTGVLGDAERVAEALGTLGLEVSRCVGAEATRERLLQACRRLIDACGPDDAAVLYYAGHGAWSPEPGVGFQFLVPVDFDRSTEEDFRGITSLELSGLLEALTARTRNVTVVLDCCFAARMFRGLDLVPRALPQVPLPLVRAHVQRLQARNVPLGGRHLESNPHAVRLVASALDAPAYEYTNARGVRTGLLTDAFLEVLAEARGLRVTWGQFGRRVRERVLARCPPQRPELEGPSRRWLFQLEEAEQERSLAYYPEHNRHWLRGGRLHGVHLGDEYAVMPLGAPGPEEGQALALARVIEVLGGTCRVELDRRMGGTLPTGAPAFPLRTVQPRRPVAVEAPREAGDAFFPRLHEGLLASALVRPTAEDETAPLLACVQRGDRGVDVFDQGGDRVVQPLPPMPSRVGEVVRVLEFLARAQALRELEDGDGAERLLEPFELEWGRVRAGQALRLPSAGACLHTQERIYVRFQNRSRARLHVSVLDVGVGGLITLVSASQPSGLVVGAERSELLGARMDGTLVGLPLEWPGATPPEGVRPESLVIVVSDVPLDLRPLETSLQRTTRSPPPTLEQLLQGGGGGKRSGSPGRRASVRYAVRHIRFWLDPRSAS